MRARGLQLVNASIGNNTLGWYLLILPAQTTASELQLILNGKIQVDSIWLGQAERNATGPRTSPDSGVVVTSSSFTQYDGEVENGTAFVVLSQGFDPGWVMNVGSADEQSMIVDGWANGFPVPHTGASGQTQFEILFSGQAAHVILVTIQAITLGTLLALPVVWAVPPLRSRILLIIRHVKRSLRE
jgi:hypothetical protein